jgi:hypothetical protein
MAEPATLSTDSRRTHAFYVDDDLIDTYAEQIGVNGIAVYTLLVRYAKRHHAWPGYKTITAKLHIGRSTLVRTLARLERVGLITITRRYTTAGDRDTNLYTILDLHQPPEQLTLEGGPTVAPGGPMAAPRWSCNGSTVVPEQDWKESHLKESHLRKDTPPSPSERGGVCDLTPLLRSKRPKKTPRPPSLDEQQALYHHVTDTAFQGWYHSTALPYDLDDQWARFMIDAGANGREYADWRDAFKNWLLSPFRRIPTGDEPSKADARDARNKATSIQLEALITNGRATHTRIHQGS